MKKFTSIVLIDILFMLMYKYKEVLIRQIIAFIDRLAEWNLAILLPQGDDKKWNGYRP